MSLVDHLRTAEYRLLSQTLIQQALSEIKKTRRLGQLLTLDPYITIQKMLQELKALAGQATRRQRSRPSRPSRRSYLMLGKMLLP